MFKGLFRLGILVVTGKFLKPRIRGLLMLAGFWCLLWFLQSEYLNYVDYSGDTTYIMHAAIMKVFLILFSLATYIFSIERGLIKKPEVVPQPEKVTLKKSPKQKGEKQTPVDLEGHADDGFEFLRKKRTLRNNTQLLPNSHKS